MQVTKIKQDFKTLDAIIDERILIDFFRDEGHWLGQLGDGYGWTPAETAIAAMREFLKINPYPAISQIQSVTVPLAGSKTNEQKD